MIQLDVDTLVSRDTVTIMPVADGHYGMVKFVVSSRLMNQTVPVHPHAALVFAQAIMRAVDEVKAHDVGCCA